MRVGIGGKAAQRDSGPWADDGESRPVARRLKPFGDVPLPVETALSGGSDEGVYAASLSAVEGAVIVEGALTKEANERGEIGMTAAAAEAATRLLQGGGDPAHGTPMGATGYTLCLYAGSAMATVALPAGSNWQTAGSKGFKFQDNSGVPDGARKALLKSGAAGKARALVNGKGTNLPDTLVPMLPLPVTVQLLNDATSTCFEAVVLKNDAKQFKAKAP